MPRRFALVISEIAAPRRLGALFCLLGLLATGACKKKASTPDWNTPGGSTQAAVEAAPTAPSPAVQPAAPTESVENESADESEANPAVRKNKSSPITASSDGLRFIAYNVENWLTMDRYLNRKAIKGSPKPDSEKTAVINILARNKPDVVGLCEVGQASDLAEIQEKLKAAGVDLPNSHYTGGVDPTRHLGLLSRFPIVSTAKPAETEYRLNGKTFGINRGILDATVQARGKSYRFVGVHLKSKRESEQGDQEAIRLNESRLLRRHLDSILKADANSRVIVYGDFNDTRATQPIKTITGKYSDPTYLTAIPTKDSHGEAWTHYWALHDIYSRFDFIMVTRGMRKEVDYHNSRIIDDADWNDASDHRPVLAIFR